MWANSDTRDRISQKHPTHHLGRRSARACAFVRLRLCTSAVTVNSVFTETNRSTDRKRERLSGIHPSLSPPSPCSSLICLKPVRFSRPPSLSSPSAMTPLLPSRAQIRYALTHRHIIQLKGENEVALPRVLAPSGGGGEFTQPIIHL